MKAIPRVHPVHVRAVAGLLDEADQGRAPADVILAGHFRRHRQMGSRDRALVGELFYEVLRHRRLLDWRGGRSDNLARTLCALAKRGWLDPGLARKFGGSTPKPCLTPPAKDEFEALDPAIRYSLPDWLARAWIAQFGEEEARALAAAMNRQAPVDLRANTLRLDRDRLREILALDGIEALETPHAPEGLRLAGRQALTRLKAFRDGLFEVQDEGSQIVGLATGVEPGMQVLDLCAGAGGKSLQMAAMMQGRGEIIACDVSARRLQNLLPRARRAGAGIVHPMTVHDEQDPVLGRFCARFDVILVDAPCSGLGTLRRSPELKWRDPDVLGLRGTQERLLEAASRMLAPGGRIVYATCSLLDVENDQVIDATRRAGRLVPAALALPPSLEVAQAARLTLTPHRHGTDGFFLAGLTRG
ncbi:MAG: RsmB/NOP family class I SAM-dependent RNA methyltransferase [Halothiobacillaceae bacterium]